MSDSKTDQINRKIVAAFTGTVWDCGEEGASGSAHKTEGSDCITVFELQIGSFFQINKKDNWVRDKLLLKIATLSVVTTKDVLYVLELNIWF